MKGLLTSLITVLAFAGLNAQLPPSSPKVVIGLTIDQLRTDYLEAFASLYGERGFKRIWKEGRVFAQASYSFGKVDRASAIAAIYSGTTPSVNGIIANQWLDLHTLRPTGCVDDPAFMGNYTNESSSPARLLVSTLADELKIATRNKALVYAIAPFRDAAILAAGHAGDGAYWLNTQTGKWCGTTYYKDFPWWIGQYNDRNRVRRPITGTLMNDEVNALATEMFEKSDMGKDDITDLLALTYYAGDYADAYSQEGAQSIQEAYVRMDRNLAELLDLIDRKVGLNNALIFITSTGYAPGEAADFDLYRIPGGQFYLNRCAALLNMYLSATYGAGQYVEAFYEQQIYLNHKLIENKQLSLVDVQEKAADFLIQFSGVNEVYSAHRILLGAWTPDISLIRNGYHRKRSGDLQIEVLPGWSVINENVPDEKFVRHAYMSTPIIFMGYQLKPAIIQTPVTIEHIAPTLANFLRIRGPNACKLPPLTNVR